MKFIKIQEYLFYQAGEKKPNWVECEKIKANNTVRYVIQKRKYL